MASVRRPYDRDEVIERLRRKGLIPTYVRENGNPVLSHWDVPRRDDFTIGIKCWGYIDFIGRPVFGLRKPLECGGVNPERIDLRKAS